jgi:hypothetical protein
MELIREHLIYKNVPIKICMKDLKPIEQYEVVRLILASNSNNVSICTHESTNSYIDNLLKKLPVTFIQCFQVEASKLVFSSEEGAGGSETFSS